MNKSCIAMVFLLFVARTGCSVTDNTVVSKGCVGGNLTIYWEYSDAGSMNSVTWEFISGTTTLILVQGATGDAVVQNNFNVEHNSNGEIKLTDLTTANVGTYRIAVTYSSATPSASDTFEVTAIYDPPSGLGFTDVDSLVTCTASSQGTPAATLYLKVDGKDTGAASGKVDSGKKAECCLTGNSVECMTTASCLTVRADSTTTTTSTSTTTTSTSSSSSTTTTTTPSSTSRSTSTTSTVTSTTPTSTSTTSVSKSTTPTLTSATASTTTISTTSVTSSATKTNSETTAAPPDSSSSETVVIIVVSVVGGLFAVGIVITIILMLLKRKKPDSIEIHKYKEDRNNWQFQRPKSLRSVGHSKHDDLYDGKHSRSYFKQNPVFVRHSSRPDPYRYQPRTGRQSPSSVNIYPGLFNGEQYSGSRYVGQDRRVYEAPNYYNPGDVERQYYIHPSYSHRSNIRNPVRETLHTDDQNYIAADYSKYW